MEGLSILYLHPDQVHRAGKIEDVTVYVLAITDENIDPEYLNMLETITPARPLVLTNKNAPVITQTIFLCLKIAERKHEKLYLPLLKHSCNVLIALMISQYLALYEPPDKLSRFDIVTRSFKSLLECNFITIKRPMDYAKKLNISVPYLNECVKNSTGHPVSYHILQRVVLEAKRLLYHSNRSVKE
ncbi:MAG: AraC family transcriptional regulator, partial [Sphingobacteriaceae bacterium]